MDVTFFGRASTSLSGERKPLPTVQINPGAVQTYPDIKRRLDGLYERVQLFRNRCGNLVPLGAADICVMDDYGFLVRVGEGERPWW